MGFHKHIQVQTQDFDLQAEYAQLRAVSQGIGAIVQFVGLMRDINEGDEVSTLFLEHYPGMTEKSLDAIVEQARERWPLLGVRLIHRVGELTPSDQIVMVMVASAHRQAAFAACDFIMDFLKTRAPFWKKEQTPDGSRWVDAKDSDNQAAERWQSDMNSQDK